MKRYLLPLICALTYCILSSCEKETVLTVDQSSLSFTDAGGSQTVSLTANKAWSASAAQAWCKVSPSAGDEAAGSRITITCDANTTYDERSCAVTFTCAEKTVTVNVTQATNHGLVVGQTSFELTKAAQKLEIPVQANVKFSVEVAASCKDWIKYSTTKGLTTSTVVLDISENKTYDNREGQVTIKEEGGSLSSTISIKQTQLDGLFISTPEYHLSNESHTLTVEVSTNVEFDVTPGADWVKYVQTKGLSTKQIILEVAENNTYDQRETAVNVKQKNGDLSGTIKIKQDEKYGILVTQSEYTLSNAAQTIDVEVKYNVEFDVVIPDECKDWIELISTKSLSYKSFTFSISKNGSYDARKGSITFKQKNGPISGSLLINQAQTDYLSVESDNFIVSKEAQTLSIKVESNVQYDVEVEESSQSWISKTGTKSINGSSIYLSVSKNEGDARIGKIIIRGNNEIVPVSINQEGVYPIIYYTSTDGQPVWPNSVEEVITDVQLDGIISNTYENGVGRLALSDTVSILPKNSFCRCSTLVSIKIPSSISTIGFGTFASCVNLESVDLPQGLIKIDSAAFENCESLKEINLPEGLITLGIFAFDRCYNLERVSFPSSLNRIPSYAFQLCQSLKSVTIPGSIKTIDSNAFAECAELEYLNLGDGVESFGEDVFMNCAKLKCVTIPGSMKNLGEEAFKGCVGLVSAVICEGVQNLGSGLFTDCTSLIEVTIPKSVESMVATFSGCISLKEISLPETMKSLAGAFYGCISLEKVVLPTTCTTGRGFNGTFGGCAKITEVEVPYGVTELVGTFSRCSSLSRVVIPDTVEEIGQTFLGCLSLKTIDLPESLKRIQLETFMDCKGLESIVIPQKVISMHAYHLFVGCDQLNRVEMLPTTPPIIEDYPESAWYLMFPKGITIIVPKGSKESYLAAPGWEWFHDYSAHGHIIERE